MFIEYIEITNYRPFYGTQRIDFGYDYERNLTIIEADNGFGKTSLVNALTWCLYDQELHDMKNKSKPKINQKAMDLAEEEDVLSLKVQIKFYEEDSDFIITRKLNYYNFGNGWQNSGDSELIVDETDKPTLTDDEAQIAINDKIPKEMFNYFFFNGATLSDYFNNEKDNSLKKSVEQISQIGLVDKVQEHLQKTYDKISKRTKEYSSDKSINYSILINEKINEKTEAEKKKNEVFEELQTSITNKKIAEDKLNEIDSEELNNLIEERKKLESTISNNKNSLSITMDNYNDLILELYPIVITFKDILKAYHIAEESQQKKTAPPKIDKEVINDLIKEGICICGTNLNENKECRDKLEKIRDKVSNVGNTEFNTSYYGIKKLLNRLKDLDKINLYKKQINTLRSNNVSLKSQLDEINKKIDNINRDDVEFYQKQRKENEKNIKDYQIKYDNLDSNIKSLEKDIEKYQSLRSQQEIDNKELEILNKKIEFCENTLNILSNLNEEIHDYIRNKVNENTKNQFIQINWANNKYTDVNIGKNYDITITENDGYTSTPGDLSDGEESLLALSFMIALHTLSGFEIPLIIDAPLEKLDAGKRLDFIDELHDYTFDKQIIFLFTDTQYTSEVRGHMLKNIFDEYELKKIENQTQITKKTIEF